jgi:hypothetical protein
LATVGGLSAAACGGANPLAGTNALVTTPSAVAVAAVGLANDNGSRTLTKDVVTFTLANGTFTFTSPNGSLKGTFGGLVAVPIEGRPKVGMTLQVTEGTSAFAGATGTLVGEGGGAFVTGGDFVLRLTGDVRTSAEPGGVGFHATVVGEATLPLACSASNRRISRLRGEGTIPTVGRSGMEFDSEIVETNCL